MEDPVRTILERGIARHGDLGIPPEKFRAHMAALPATTTAHLLNAEDLYLAAACAAGCESAWTALDREYRRDIQAWCRRYGSPGQSRDLCSDVWAALVTPGAKGLPRIATYEGLSPLANWLRTIVRRRSIDLARSARPEVPGEPRDVPDPRGRQRVEERVMRRRFSDAVAEALRMAVEGLDHEDANLLALRFRDEIPLGELARLRGIHQANVTRRIERICRDVRRSAASHLEGKFGLHPRLLDDYLSAAAEGGWPEVAALCFEALSSA